MADKTKIRCIDVDKDIEEYLQEEHEVFSGSFGTRISMPKNAISSNYVLPNYVFPVNIHEYDVFVVDNQVMHREIPFNAAKSLKRNRP